MKHEQMLDRLIDNALDFLDRSLADFDTAPKYSVIHFYSAVELFLKARLLAEHWSLVVTKRQDPDLKRFESGDFQSVSLDEAANKLDNILQSPLSSQELVQFQRLAKHRNRMVHFYHDLSSAGAEDKLKKEIASEQLKAWYFLNRLLLDRWAVVFEKWKDKLTEVTVKLKQHHRYLKVVYDHLKPEIDAKTKNGITIEECLSCGFVAAEATEVLAELKHTACMVCQFDAEYLAVSCPDCDNIVIFVNDGFSSCSVCGKKFEANDLASLLTDPQSHTKDYFESGLPAHCTYCQDLQTVVEYGGQYLCTNCFTIFEEEALNHCDWCNDLNAGDMEGSNWRGCVACEGREGHYQGKDD